MTSKNKKAAFIFSNFHEYRINIQKFCFLKNKFTGKQTKEDLYDCNSFW